ncbi:MAG: 50S ribosomal protein L18 [Candidatus Omnitrophota bacterium]|nr:50S ribosomal protein L18 [Candidatus Omnitrophota bacterium]
MKTVAREQRHVRITKRMEGTAAKPRVVVFRSNKNMSVQFVDDSQGKVMTGCSTLSKAFRAQSAKTADKEAAKVLGTMAAGLAVARGIKEICFDRAGYKFHGKVKALAEGLREGGLRF